MKTKLSDDDSRAVDLVLNSETAVTAGGHMYAASAHTGLGVRIKAAEKVLSALSLMPVDDVPADLVSKTLRRIEEAASGLTVEPREARPTPMLETGSPVA